MFIANEICDMRSENPSPLRAADRWLLVGHDGPSRIPVAGALVLAECVHVAIEPDS